MEEEDDSPGDLDEELVCVDSGDQEESFIAEGVIDGFEVEIEQPWTSGLHDSHKHTQQPPPLKKFSTQSTPVRSSLEASFVREHITPETKALVEEKSLKRKISTGTDLEKLADQEEATHGISNLADIQEEEDTGEKEGVCRSTTPTLEDQEATRLCHLTTEELQYARALMAMFSRIQQSGVSHSSTNSETQSKQ